MLVVSYKRKWYIVACKIQAIRGSCNSRFKITNLKPIIDEIVRAI